MKIKLNLPNNYFDLSPDEKIFFDELLDNKDVKEIEILKQSYKQIVTHIDGFVDSLEKVDSILYSEE